MACILELATPAEIALPPELPYRRHQVLAAVKTSRTPAQGFNLRQSLALAWQPALLGARFFPGSGLLPRLPRLAARELAPARLNWISLTERLWHLARRVGKGGRNKR